MNWPKFMDDYHRIVGWLENLECGYSERKVISILLTLLQGTKETDEVIRVNLPNTALSEIPDDIYQTISRWKLCIPRDAAVLGEIYQRVSSGRKAQGLYYTPVEVVDFILKKTLGLHDIAADPYIKVLDPSCGCGYFLLRAYDMLFASYQQARSELSDRYPEHDWSDDGIHDHIISVNLWGADIDEIAVDIAQTGLFMKRPGFSHELKPNLLVCDSLKRGNENSTHDSVKQFWSSKYNFVVGNPPYLSFGLRGAGRLEPEYAEYLRQAFKETAEYKISYYALFMQRGIEMLSEGGKLGFIVPDSFLLGRYFSKIRRYILDNTVINAVAHITTPVFKGATVGSSAICVMTKTADAERRNSQVISIYKSSTLSSLKSEDPISTLAQSYYGSTPHNRFRLFFDAKAKELIDKIETAGQPLKSFASGHTGIRSLSKQSEIVSEICLGPNWRQGLVSGRQVSRYSVMYQGHWLNIDSKALYSGGWRAEIISQRKILLRQTGYTLTAAIDDNGYYHLNNLHSFVAKGETVTLDYLLMLINSRLMSFYYHVTSMEYGRVMAQTDIETIELLPIKVHEDISGQAPGLVKALTGMYKSKSKGDKEAICKTYALNEYLNQLVYRIYGLTDEEILYIENFENKM